MIVEELKKKEETKMNIKIYLDSKKGEVSLLNIDNYEAIDLDSSQVSHLINILRSNGFIDNKYLS